MNIYNSENNLVAEIYDLIKSIRDPEKPQTLEELEIVNENDISVKVLSKCVVISIKLTPTVPHCSFASIIGLCIREKVERFWGKQLKLDIFFKEGTHSIGDIVNKQINDKERIAAALENPELLKIVENCIKETDD